MALTIDPAMLLAIQPGAAVDPKYDIFSRACELGRRTDRPLWNSHLHHRPVHVQLRKGCRFSRIPPAVIVKVSGYSGLCDRYEFSVVEKFSRECP